MTIPRQFPISKMRKTEGNFSFNRKFQWFYKKCCHCFIWYLALHFGVMEFQFFFENCQIFFWKNNSWQKKLIFSQKIFWQFFWKNEFFCQEFWVAHNETDPCTVDHRAFYSPWCVLVLSYWGKKFASGWSKIMVRRMHLPSLPAFSGFRPGLYRRMAASTRSHPDTQHHQLLAQYQETIYIFLPSPDSSSNNPPKDGEGRGQCGKSIAEESRRIDLCTLRRSLDARSQAFFPSWSHLPEKLTPLYASPLPPPSLRHVIESKNTYNVTPPSL